MSKAKARPPMWRIASYSDQNGNRPLTAKQLRRIRKATKHYNAMHKRRTLSRLIAEGK